MIDKRKYVHTYKEETLYGSHNINNQPCISLLILHIVRHKTIHFEMLLGN